MAYIHRRAVVSKPGPELVFVPASVAHHLLSIFFDYITSCKKCCYSTYDSCLFSQTRTRDLLPRLSPLSKVIFDTTLPPPHAEFSTYHLLSLKTSILVIENLPRKIFSCRLGITHKFVCKKIPKG